jgi:ribonucleoside-diphosphate reductase alpha chain
MNVVKRDGTVEQVKFDKISSRIRKQTYGLNEDYVDYFQVAQKVISGLYDGVTSNELDKLSAETAASMITTHPDYGKLAARITITSLYKDVAKEFSTVAKELYEYINPVNDEPAGLISDEVYAIIEKNATVLNAMIVHDRDFNFDYFGYKTLEKSYLLQRHGKPAETPQQMYMRVSVGIWRDNLEMVQKTYDLLSQGLFTHATPTLFNSGTKRPQMSSCFLLDIDDDSIPGIYKTLSDCAKISQSAGGIGINIHKIRAKGSYIKGTNGWSNGIVPMLRVFNETARYVDQCFVPDTLINTENGLTNICDITPGDKVLTTSGYESVLDVKEFDSSDKTLYKLSDGENHVLVTEEHPFLCVKTDVNDIDLIREKIKAGILHLEWVNAKDLSSDYMVVK